MNTRLDKTAYDCAYEKCTVCNNPVVITRTGDAPFCVRCNITLPNWMINKRRSK